MCPCPRSPGANDDDAVVHPDDLKMPERVIHRQTVDLLALAATRLLGHEVRIFRDLNWYPSDGGNAVAPDVMVLPRSAIDELPRSYRQDQTDGPAPSVVIEIASDTFASLLAKARRYQRLGPAVYLIVVEGDPCVFRLGAADDALVEWTGRPMAELGSPALGFTDDGQPLLTMPDGATATTDGDLVTLAEERAETAQERAAAAEARAEALAAKLRELGHTIEPEPGS